MENHALGGHPNIYTSGLNLLVLILVLILSRAITVDSYRRGAIGTPACAVGQTRECGGGGKVRGMEEEGSGGGMVVEDWGAGVEGFGGLGLVEGEGGEGGGGGGLVDDFHWGSR